MLYITIPVTYWFYAWKFVPLTHSLHFCPSPHLFPLWQKGNMVPSLRLWDCFCFFLFVHLFSCLDATCKWNHTAFVLLWLTSRDSLLFPSSSASRWHWRGGVTAWQRTMQAVLWRGVFLPSRDRTWDWLYLRPVEAYAIYKTLRWMCLSSFLTKKKHVSRLSAVKDGLWEMPLLYLTRVIWTWKS